MDDRAQRTILLADDEPNLRLLVRITLEDPEYRLFEASDGEQALRLARNLATQDGLDLILLDWMMPVMSGIEVAAALKKDKATADIPIIMLTAKSQRRDLEAGKRVGVNAYLIKPFSPLELIEDVEKALAGQLHMESNHDRQ